jgi:hypothetical protein
MKKTKLAKAIGFAIAGAALTAGSVSTVSASTTTMYNLFHANSNGFTAGVANPCAPCAAGETDGWVWGGVADSTPTGTDTIETSSPTINAAPGAGWVGTAAANKTPLGYTGGGVLHWGLEITGGQGGTGTISNADAIARYNVSADIDVAKGAWSDNISTNVGVAGGWRHDLDYGLFKSDTTGLTTLTATRVNGNGQTNNIGFTIFKGMDTSLGSYLHHGAWNSTTNAGGLTNNSLPGGGTKFGANNAAAIANIVAYSIGDPNVSLTTGTNLNTISFNAEAGQAYTIVLGGYRNGDWNTTTDGYSLNVSQVPVPGAVWLFGSAMAGLIGFGRRKSNSAA